MSIFKAVYGWMSAALLVTSVVAYVTSTSPAILSLMLNPLLFFGLFMMMLILVGVLSTKIHTLSFPAALGILMAYAALNGLVLSSIFIYYEIGTIATAFVSTVGLFVILTIIAFVTKSNFEKFGPIAFAGLLGVVFASIVNIFLGNSMLDMVISIVGVLIFTVLTIVDTKKIRLLSANPQFASEEAQQKLGVIGALMLYLDFLNIFLFLLRLLGRRR